MNIVDWLYEVSGHAQLDREEEKFKFGNKVKVVGLFQSIIQNYNNENTLSTA